MQGQRYYIVLTPNQVDTFSRDLPILEECYQMLGPGIEIWQHGDPPMMLGVTREPNKVEPIDDLHDDWPEEAFVERDKFGDFVLAGECSWEVPAVLRLRLYDAHALDNESYKLRVEPLLAVEFKTDRSGGHPRSPFKSRRR